MTTILPGSSDSSSKQVGACTEQQAPPKLQQQQKSHLAPTKSAGTPKLASLACAAAAAAAPAGFDATAFDPTAVVGDGMSLVPARAQWLALDNEERTHLCVSRLDGFTPQHLYPPASCYDPKKSYNWVEGSTSVFPAAHPHTGKFPDRPIHVTGFCFRESDNRALPDDEQFTVKRDHLKYFASSSEQQQQDDLQERLKPPSRVSSLACICLAHVAHTK